MVRGALRQQTAFTLVLLAMERLTILSDHYGDHQNFDHQYDKDDDDDVTDDYDYDDATGISDKSILRQASLFSHRLCVFSIQVMMMMKMMMMI